jgi:membrane-associated protease RseP (regulator of RpoE activity)
MLKRNLLPTLGAFAVVAFTCAASLKAQTTSSNPAAAPQSRNEQSSQSRNEQPARDSNAFLGVGVERIPPSLAAHMREQLSKSGLLVAEVAEDSPAAKAGIKQYDILTTCDDQRLMSPEQLINLIRAEKPGKNVSLGIIREGKSETVNATLSEMPASERAATGERSRGERRMRRGPEFTERFREFEEMPGLAGARGGVHPNWERFESLNLEKTGKDQFKAAISFRNEKGETERREFTGTREQIGKDIHNLKDLPREERVHLLAALDMRNSRALPGVRFIPGEGLVIDLGDFMPEEGQQQPNQNESQQPQGGKQL